MSYSRWGPDSDIYMFENVEGYIECMVCMLLNKSGMATKLESMKFTKRSDAIEHLNDHRSAGHKVPKRAIERLKFEMVICDIVGGKNIYGETV